MEIDYRAAIVASLMAAKFLTLLWIDELIGLITISLIANFFLQMTMTESSFGLVAMFGVIFDFLAMSVLFIFFGVLYGETVPEDAVWQNEIALSIFFCSFVIQNILFAWRSPADWILPNYGEFFDMYLAVLHFTGLAVMAEQIQIHCLDYSYMPCNLTWILLTLTIFVFSLISIFLKKMNKVNDTSIIWLLRSCFSLFSLFFYLGKPGESVFPSRRSFREDRIRVSLYFVFYSSDTDPFVLFIVFFWIVAETTISGGRRRTEKVGLNFFFEQSTIRPFFSTNKFKGSFEEKKNKNQKCRTTSPEMLPSDMVVCITNNFV